MIVRNPFDGGLHLSLTYQSDLFTAAHMREWLDQYAELLQQAAAQPQAPIDRLSLVTPAARAWLPDLAAPMAALSAIPVTRVFTAQAARSPTAAAVIQGQSAWTYAELDAAVQHLARTLRAAGMQQGDAVAVTGARSFGLIAALLGALHVGGVIVPIDPGLPRARRQTMLTAARARWLLLCDGGAPAADGLDAGPTSIDPAIRSLHIDAASGRCADCEAPEDAAAALPEISGADPAYVFFTSGSTGVPKGVQGLHAGLAHFIAWQRERFGIGPDDRVAQLTGLSFDVMLRDLFLPLCSGAALCLPQDGDAADIPRWLAQSGITVLHSVPTLLQSWVEATPAALPLPRLRYLFSAGEPLTDALVTHWRSAFPGNGTVVNLYGPTETTLAKCYHVVPEPPDPGVQPVGTPLPNTQALVMGAAGRLCGVGETGEIVLRTPARTAGYLDPALHAFRPNPVRDDPDDLLYRTGDRGRYRADGLLEIHGRLDDQVKIRGVRVEPAEVSALLARHPAIAACHVMPVPSEAHAGEKELHAWVVPRAAAPLDLTALRDWLARQLPAALVPSRFGRLDALPHTANGKVDRKALPRLATAAPAASTAPRDELEGRIAQIWAEVLGLQRVGIHDDYFALGGHSLLAVKLMAALQEQLGCRLPLATLFEASTVAKLAALIAGGTVRPWSPLVPIKPNGSYPPLFCIHPAGGNVLGYQEFIACLDAEQPVYGIQAFGVIEGQTPQHDIGEMARGYIAAMRSVQPQGPYYLGGESFGGRVAYEMACQLCEQGERIAYLFLGDTWTTNVVHYSRLRHAWAHVAYPLTRPWRDWREWLLRRLTGRRANLKPTRRFRFADTLHRANVMAHRRASAGFRPRPLNAKVALFRARVHTHRVGLLQHCFGTPAMCWTALAQQGVEVHWMPDWHAEMMHGANAPGFAQTLQQDLDRARQAAPGQGGACPQEHAGAQA